MTTFQINTCKMKKIIFMLCIGIAISILDSCENKKSETKEMKTASVQYTCPMHPEVLSDKPGSCPKCGMDLVKKEPSK